MRLNDVEFDIIWTMLQLFLKLHSHNSVLWLAYRTSVISKFSFMDIGVQNENPEITENLYFLNL